MRRIRIDLLVAVAVRSHAGPTRIPSVLLVPRLSQEVYNRVLDTRNMSIIYCF